MSRLENKWFPTCGKIKIGDWLGITEEKMRGRVDKKTVIFVYYWSHSRSNIQILNSKRFRKVLFSLHSNTPQAITNPPMKTPYMYPGGFCTNSPKSSNLKVKTAAKN